MGKNHTRQPILTTFYRSAAFLAIFLLLHYAYEWTNWSWIKIFSATGENTLQHMKIGFYTFIIISLSELLIFRKRIQDRSRFVYSRMLGAMLLPWGMFLLWYIAAAVYGPFPNIIMDIVYANIVTILLIIMTFTLSYEWQKISFSNFAKFWILLLIFNTIFLFTAFTYSTPWAPFF
jgi:hypothetical protein